MFEPVATKRNNLTYFWVDFHFNFRYFRVFRHLLQVVSRLVLATSMGKADKFGHPGHWKQLQAGIPAPFSLFLITKCLICFFFILVSC